MGDLPVAVANNVSNSGTWFGVPEFDLEMETKLETIEDVRSERRTWVLFGN
jgi:hypothetical protein